MTATPDPALAISPGILAIDPDEMRRLGYWVVDRVIEHLDNARPAGGRGRERSGHPEAALGGPAPRNPHPIDVDLATLADTALANQQHGDHPRYFARVAGPSSFPAILGDWLATGMQSVASSWGGGSGPTTVELVVCEWLRDALGLAPTSEGVLLSGGSMANITAIVTARHQRGDGIVYLCDQTHSSIVRGLVAIGQPADRMRVIASDDSFRLSPQDLQRQVESDVAAGQRPLMVIATAGTTNTGAVDDLPAIADLCERHGMWLHVDGAYGGAAALCARGRAAMPGLDAPTRS